MLRSRLSLTGGLASVLIVLAGAAAVSLAASSSAPSSHLDAPADLRCDGLREPLALAEASPMFSWQLEASSEGLHAVSQSAYRIQVADGGAQPHKLLWDSGVVHSGATAEIAYGGRHSSHNMLMYGVSVFGMSKGIPARGAIMQAGRRPLTGPRSGSQDKRQRRGQRTRPCLCFARPFRSGSPFGACFCMPRAWARMNCESMAIR